MKRILITGSNGFIGRALKKRLLHNENVVFDMDLDKDVAFLESFEHFESENIDYVFHLAGKTYVPDSWKNPSSFYRVNFTGTLNMLDFCRKNSAALTFVSAYLYGRPSKLPVSEDDSVVPNNPYAHSKFLAEQACEFYAREFGLEIVIIRPFNVYGPGQKDNFLLPHIIKQAMESDEINVKNLSPKRDYVYLDDLIDALLISMDADKQFSRYNVGSGYSLSVEEVIAIIQEEIGTAKKVVSTGSVRKNEIHDVIADISKIERDFGWKPKHSFRQGIKAIVESMSRESNGKTNTCQ